MTSWAAVANHTATWLMRGGSTDDLTQAWSRVVGDPMELVTPLLDLRGNAVAVQLLLPVAGDPSGVPGDPWQVQAAIEAQAALVILGDLADSLVVTGQPSATSQHWSTQAQSLVGSWPQRRDARIQMQRAMAEIPAVLQDLPRLGFDADLAQQVRLAAQSPLPALSWPDGVDLSLFAQARTALLVAALADPAGGRTIDSRSVGPWRESMAQLAHAGRVGLAACVSGPISEPAR